MCTLQLCSEIFGFRDLRVLPWVVCGVFVEDVECQEDGYRDAGIRWRPVMPAMALLLELGCNICFIAASHAGILAQGCAMENSLSCLM